MVVVDLIETILNYSLIVSLFIVWSKAQWCCLLLPSVFWPDSYKYSPCLYLSSITLAGSLLRCIAQFVNLTAACGKLGRAINSLSCRCVHNLVKM